MTDDEIDEAIAVCIFGLAVSHEQTILNMPWKNKRGHIMKPVKCGKSLVGSLPAELPRYSRDLESAWDMEQVIALRGLCEEYITELASILGFGHQKIDKTISMFDLVHVGPKSRCLAALKVHEKMEGKGNQ
jgi:hypothetical protein